jgi:CRISPR-associated protein (TIGR03986 family)
MTIPRHINPTRLERTSRAPYNFVPLPAAVFHPDGLTDDALALHDRYPLDRHTGWIDLAITTESPTYVRGAPPADRSAEEPYEPFFHHGDERHPVIPGSTLRGMTRALVEILAYARLAHTKSRRLYFRSLSPNVLTDHYQARRGGPNPDVRAGIFRRTAAGTFIEPRDLARVAYTVIDPRGKAFVFIGRPPNRLPNPRLYNRRVIVRLGQQLSDGLRPVYDVAEIRPAAAGGAPGPEERSGVLVISGDAPTKEREFVFLDRGGDNAEPPLPVPQALVDDFESDDQITPWQKSAFPPDGRLKDGAPVFYLVDEAGAVTALGRASAFRLPYQGRTTDMAPASVVKAEPQRLDLAEAIFGTVSEQRLDGVDRILKGRVFFEDAPWDGDGGDPFLGGWEASRRSPKILNSPKPTAFQHYLVQRQPDDADALLHYDSSPTETAIRGSKRYWHKPRQPEDAIFEGAVAQDTQHTAIRPVRPGVTFRGRVRFENLSTLELGALLAVLDLPPEARHQIGMGKPLGMGSVRVTPTVHLIDPAARYAALVDNDGRITTGERGADDCDVIARRATDEFRRAIIEHHNATDGEPALPDTASLWEVPRLAELRAMLSWDDAPPAKRTSYIPLDEDDPSDRRSGRRRSWWTVRPVLPTPVAVKYPPPPPAPAVREVPAQPEPFRRQEEAAQPAGVGGGTISEEQQARLERLRSALAGPPRAGIAGPSGQDAAAAADRQQAPPVSADPNVWSDAEVRLQNQILVAESGRRTARSRLADTAELLDSLAAEQRTALQRGRRIKAQVRITPGPRGNEIVAIVVG